MWTSIVSHSVAPTGSYATSMPTVVNYPNTSSTTIYINPPTAIASAISASYALTASYALNGGSGGTSLVTGSSYPITSSWAESASWAPTSHAVTSTSASWASSSLSASYAPFIQTYQTSTTSASYASSSLSASYLVPGTYQITASWAGNAIVSNTSLYASQSQWSVSSSYASSSTTAGTATNLGLTAYNISVTYASQSQWSITSSYASSSLSSSYALTATSAISASYAPATLDGLTDVIISSAQLDEVLGYNGVEWVNRPSAGAVSAGAATTYYLTQKPTPGGNDTLSTVPDITAQYFDTASVNNSIASIERFISPVLTGNIDAGTWLFHTFAQMSVGTNTGTTQVHTRINRSIDITGSVSITGTGLSRTASFTNVSPLVPSDTGSSNNILTATLIQTPSQSFWVSQYSSSTIAPCQPSDIGYVNETNVSASLYYLLFRVTTGDITGNATQLFETTTTQPAYSMSLGNKLVAAYFAQTDNAANKTVGIYHGGTSSYSRIDTPLVTRHNDLSGLQGGSSGQYYHLTSNQYTELGVSSSYASSALTSSFLQIPSGSGAWRQYIDFSTGDLVFSYS